MVCAASANASDELSEGPSDWKGMPWSAPLENSEELARVGKRADARMAYELALWRLREAPDASLGSPLVRWIARD